MYIDTHIHSHTHTHTYIYIYTHLHTHTHIYIYIYTLTHSHIYTYLHTRIYIHTYTYTGIYVYITGSLAQFYHRPINTKDFEKCYLTPPSLTLGIMRYRSRVSRAIQRKESHPFLLLDVVVIEKGAFNYGRPT